MSYCLHHLLVNWWTAVADIAAPLNSISIDNAATDRLLDSLDQTGPNRVTAVHSNAEVLDSNNIPGNDNNMRHNNNETGGLHNNALYQNTKCNICTALTNVKGLSVAATSYEFVDNAPQPLDWIQARHQLCPYQC